MQKSLFLILTSLTLAACGADTDGGGGNGDGGGSGGTGGTPLLQVVGSCDKNAIEVGCACSTQYMPADVADMLRPNFEAGCVAEGGRVVQVCSQENKLGTCTITQEQVVLETIQYANPNDSCDDDPVANQALCEQNNGTWE